MTANGKVKVSGFISPSLHDKLRRIANEQRIPLSTMVSEGLRAISRMSKEDLEKLPQDRRLADNS